MDRRAEKLEYVATRRPEELTLKFSGELDMNVAPALRQVFRKELDKAPPRVFIDLAEIRFLDSSIVATLVEALKLVRAKKAVLKIINCQPQVRDTFEIARLLSSFGIE